MAVQPQTPYKEYTANGSTNSFALEFDCENQDYLIVLVDGVEPVIGTWSLNGGAVVFGTAPINGKKITIQRNTPFKRDGDFQSYDNSFRPAPVNKDFDKTWWKIQELGVADWLLGLKIQKFRDDVNLTALENTLKQSRDIRDATSLLADEVQANTTQSATLLTNTTAKANAAATSATNANTAKTQAQQAVTDANGIKTDMYTALYSFQNGATKAYPTLAVANADIANIALDTKVTVLSATDGGDYYKATAGATSLTKSPYDPLAQAKAFTKDSADVFDASKVSGNYALTFDQAVALIPSDLKKRFLTLKYNNSEVLTYVNTNLTTNWTNQRFWIRLINTMAEGKINHVDERMIYKGFTLGGGASITYGADNYCVIIPLHRTYTDGVENKLNIYAYPYPLSQTVWLFLDATGTSLGALTGVAGLSNYTIPSTAQYIAINLQSKDASDVLITPENLDIAKKYLFYSPDNTVPSVSKPNTTDGFKNINYGIPAAIYEDRTRAGTEFVSPFFKNGLGSVAGLHIAQIVKHVEIQKGQQDLVVTSTGLPRRFIITQIIKSADGKTISAQISGENESGVLQVNLPTGGAVDVYGYANIEWVRMQSDVLRVKLLVDGNKIPNGATITFGDNGEIHPAVVMKADQIRDVNKGVQFTQFTDVGVAKTSSNQKQTDAQAVTLTRNMTNGFLYNTVTGDITKDHQQTTLIASKLARFYGNASIYAVAKADYPNNPIINMIRDSASIDSNVGSAAGYGVQGRTMDSQWIHPDICYSPDAVGGYKYWMINSNYTNGNDGKEDADLLVGNDGVNWTRVRSSYEADSAGFPFKLPPVYWTASFPNAFMPIPNTTNTLEFALESTIESKKIVSALNHDPAISYHNGWVNVYILYNFGFTTSTVRDNKYVVCYRTNDGVNWEIVREDGTTMPYNQENALKIFSKTGNVRNHICYRATGASGTDLSPQVVKVSDTEWYYYARQGNSNMYLVRYAGTSPYTFDFANPQSISKNNSTGGNLWHFGLRYYNGVFYCLTNGYMFTSTDGINFTTTNYPFYWRGMSSDIYKPTFVVGHDGKVKTAYSLQVHLAIPHAYAPQNPVSMVNLNRLQDYVKITATITAEYASLTDIMSRSTSPVEDAYVDIVVMSISQRTKSTQVRLLPCLRSYSELLNTLDISFDDEVYVIAYMNTRNGGNIEFSGVAVTLPNAALN
ncbi:glycoside hydrolase family protein [Acinetobacter albensis]|uniref:hypothetical protein n=1 Tax=Acinetobacter albensis TaxID=1673609 RepID=UPI001D0DE938|nr:hypothetical protein [Acinetobacter albensis]